MFRKKKTSADSRIQQMERSLETMKVVNEFFGGVELREGESAEALLARNLGITLDAYHETIRLFRSIVAGRVIPRA